MCREAAIDKKGHVMFLPVAPAGNPVWQARWLVVSAGIFVPAHSYGSGNMASLV